MSKPTKSQELLAQRWKVQENDLIGGWCITTEDSDKPSQGAFMLGDFILKEHAEHIVLLHNARIADVAAGRTSVQALIRAVADLWNQNGGWLPGSAYDALAVVLGVEEDDLTHWDNELGVRYIADYKEQA